MDSAMNYIYVAHKFSKYHMINFLLIITVLFLSVFRIRICMFLRPFESGSGPVIICTNLDPALDLDPSINKKH